MIDEFIKKLNSVDKLTLKIKVKSNAASNKIVEVLENNVIKIAIKAAPVKGKANIELIKYLAKVFKVDKNNVKITKGANKPNKIILIRKARV